MLKIMENTWLIRLGWDRTSLMLDKISTNYNHKWMQLSTILTQANSSNKGKISSDSKVNSSNNRVIFYLEAILELRINLNIQLQYN